MASSVNCGTAVIYVSMAAAYDALSMIIQGATMIGNAIVSIVLLIVGLVGVTVPDAWVRIFTIIVFLLLAWKLGSTAVKIVLALVIVCLLLGFIAPYLGV